MIWSWCWPVVFAVFGFVFVCLTKPAIEAFGKAFGEAATSKIDFQRLVDHIIQSAQRRIASLAEPIESNDSVFG